jgi:hypothetical protein
MPQNKYQRKREQMCEKGSGTFKAMFRRKCEESGNGGIKHETVSSEYKTKYGTCEDTEDNRKDE